MPEILIRATTDTLTINGYCWSAGPTTEQVCQAVGSSSLVDGDPILYDGKPGGRFRYFEDAGICILEIIPESLVRGITIFMETPPTKRKRAMPSIGSSRRPTLKPFAGILDLNGKQLRSPLRFTRFPQEGELTFVHRIAIGRGLSAGISVKSRFVESVGFDFKKTPPGWDTPETFAQY